jgi:hypothetical protein
MRHIVAGLVVSDFLEERNGFILKGTERDGYAFQRSTVTTKQSHSVASQKS